MCFNSNRPKSKTGFQDGYNGGHFGFPIGMIFAIFHLQTVAILFALWFAKRYQKKNSKMAAILDFSINKILAHNDPEDIMLL